MDKKLNNHFYNLFNQMIQEHKSIWRIEKFYLKDAKNCKKCLSFWQKLSKNKEILIKEIFDLINEHKIN